MDRLEGYADGYSGIGFLNGIDISEFPVNDVVDIYADVVGSGVLVDAAILKIAEKTNSLKLLQNEDGSTNMMVLAIIKTIGGGLFSMSDNSYVRNFGIGMVKGGAGTSVTYAVKENVGGLFDPSSINGVLSSIDFDADFDIDLGDTYADFEAETEGSLAQI